MNSIRRRLLGSVMTAIVVAALFQAASAYRGALQQADEMFDYHLQQMAFALRNGAPSQSAPEDTDDAEYEVRRELEDVHLVEREEEGAEKDRRERAEDPQQAH